MVDYSALPKLCILVISQHTPRMTFACGGHPASTTMAACCVHNGFLEVLFVYCFAPLVTAGCMVASSMVHDVLVTESELIRLVVYIPP